ncbi:PREDICTED: neuromedin-B receptor-like [Priapulus caudatus]|uniref:Neuromedin-B receptor-like n=1 Tax=Priapulus caudatus TaxID=37621 RepID=A0ABM1DRZ3_PRICU|nr:PREDICTED: neuromedin-B receptor-like [Priapulus caudatus]
MDSTTHAANATNVSAIEHVPYHMRPETYIVPVVFGFIFLLGIIGNGTLIFIVLKNKCMRNVPNIYIVSLSLGDFLLILISVPFTSTIYTVRNWPFGEVVCKLNEFLQDMSVGVSVFTLTALSADRYTAIVDPMKKHMGNPTRRTVMTSFAIWIVAICLGVPDAAISYVLFTGLHPDDANGVNVCYPYPLDWQTWYPKLHTFWKFLIYFLIPMVIISTYYSLMAKNLMLSTQNMPGEKAEKGSGAQHAAKQMEARKKVAKMVLMFVVLFVICWAPRHLFNMWFHFSPWSREQFNSGWQAFRIIGFCMSFINSCLNPVALYCLSKQFRKYYNRYLFCWCRRSPDLQTTEPNSAMYNFTSTVRRGSANSYTMVTSQTAAV